MNNFPSWSSTQLATPSCSSPKTNFHDHRRRFGIKRSDQRQHVYIVGKIGARKSTLISHLARQDLQNSEGFPLFDPHGDLVEQVLRSVSPERQGDLIYFNNAGGMLETKIGLAALSRSSLPESERRDFYLYADEFPPFTTTSFAGMLSEMRKYKLGLLLAHRYMDQVEETVRGGLRNVVTMKAFRVGLADALLLEKEFHP